MAHKRKSQLGITMPGINQPMHKFPELASLADQAGFDSVWGYEFYRNAFVMHALAATQTKNIKLCTGLATAAQRTPFEMANAAADVDELSDGRMLIATSIGGPAFAEHFNGVDIDRPAARMKEYIQVLRLYWDHMHTGEAKEFQGEFYRFSTPPFNPFGGRTLTRPRIPVYLGAVRPAMLRLAGRSCDGVLAWLLPPEHVRDIIIPQVDEAAEKAGRDPSDVDIASYVICSISEDREEAMRRARIQVGCYVAYPTAAEICEQHGLGDDQRKVAEALFQGGPAALADVTSDALVKKFSISGTPEEAKAQIDEYQEAIPHLILHTPYVPPLSAAESEDAFKNIVTTFAR
ncbi:LLM class flavin-dependent oxidoreductase [Pseudomaricurvus alkylphenolicus]|uniref:LLM class flavin-dependent oxidoreductase n=1 Tax=Pseudomaricurvus alkylphenolicus TaxID=1306991 RepID=UPI00141F5B7C|nr:LLM class flavin-dependent oxidoreductase [Pseudomaricurvus alkylphenolicus]NIB38840.1 LLM class flavin-dependent oxidoreductase [Pseudomaricurvus alkylphenolicus]